MYGTGGTKELGEIQGLLLFLSRVGTIPGTKKHPTPSLTCRLLLKAFPKPAICRSCWERSRQCMHKQEDSGVGGASFSGEVLPNSTQLGRRDVACARAHTQAHTMEGSKGKAFWEHLLCARCCFHCIFSFVFNLNNPIKLI